MSGRTAAALGTGFKRGLCVEIQVRMMSQRYYDIGLNLTDPMYRGVYNGKQYHGADVHTVISRAFERGVKAALLTGSSLKESREAIALASDSELSDRGVRLKYTFVVLMSLRIMMLPLIILRMMRSGISHYIYKFYRIWNPLSRNSKSCMTCVSSRL